MHKQKLRPLREWVKMTFLIMSFPNTNDGISFDFLNLKF